MTQKPPKRNPSPIGSSVPSQRRSDVKPVVLVEGAACAATVALLLGDRYEVVVAAPNALRDRLQTADWSWLAGREVVVWRDTEPDPASPVVRADQALDPLADFVIGALALVGVLILLAWLWWASHGGKWVAPW